MTDTQYASTSESLRASDLSRELDQLHPGPDLIDYLKDYARQRPEVAALWCFGIGFILGWKLKPW
jgi:hypothetical protein